MPFVQAHVDSLAPSSWRARPRSFVALMSLYESNFLRLAALAGDVRTLCGTHRSRVAGDCDLVLTLGERAAHTSTLLLTYVLAREDGQRQGDRLATERIPDIAVRVYHDARLCEALPPALDPARTAAEAARVERELGQRWSRNMMLNKWLDYCLERGHSIERVASRASDQAAEDQSSRCRASGAASRGR